MRLTLPQQDVYFEQLMYPDDPIYNIGAKVAIRGNINYELFNEAYVAVINQHDVYRSILDQSEEEVTVCIQKDQALKLELVDFSTHSDADGVANAFMQEQFMIPFKLDEKKLLYRFFLVKVSEKFYYLFSVYHHIITDGWGTSLMFQRVVKNYNELAEHGKILTEYPYSYREFVADDQAYFLSEDYHKDKSYWVERFRQLPDQLFDKIKNTGKLNQSKRKEIWINRADYNQLDRMGRNLKSSTFHVILGILLLYFGRKHRKNDLAIGLPVLNRGKSVFKKMVGLFMGVSPLRMQLDPEDTFEDLVRNIRRQLQQDYRYQRFPLGKLIKELQLFHEKDRLFNMTLSYEKQNYADHFAGTETTVIPLSHQSERVALAIYIREFDESADVKIDFDYNVNYFNETSITQVVTHFERLVKAVVADPQQRLFEFQYITAAEKEYLLKTLNDTRFEYPRENTMLDLFREQVRRYPDKVALADDTGTYTYEALDAASDKIAAYLRHRTNGKIPSVTGVMMTRSARLVVTLLGILKSGNAYIPLDPSFPESRIEYIIAHSGINEVIGTHNLKGTTEGFIDIETILRHQPEPLEEWKVPAEAVAYVIYTSGSTGNPKGVAVGHRSLLNFLISMQQRPGITPDDYFFSVTTQSFDISILEFFAPLVTGATVYIASPELLADPSALIGKLEALKPTIMQATPSFYQMLYHAGWNGNSAIRILCGGDLLSEALAEKMLATTAGLWNMYGPTETTIWSACKEILQPKDASNIGSPINNTTVYILDEYRQLLPAGSVGNIYIGGDGVAQGYFKAPDLTVKRFVPSPFEADEVIYDTGDLGRWNENGEIEFFGRNDQQVKIRGYRIELGEIEAQLNQLPAVKNSVVVAKKGAAQEAFLVAYVLPEAADLDSKDIIRALQATLPAYMVPNVIISLSEFPLTPNKKVDRKALSLREITPEKSDAAPEKPATDMETVLCGYFRDVLSLRQEISVSDNFFALGGHSLNAIKLIRLIGEGLHYKIILRDIFEYPTIQMLAKHLEGSEQYHPTDIVPAEERPYYAITAGQRALWLAAQQESRSIAYNMPAAFKVVGTLNKIVLEQVFLEILKKYDVLRSNFPEVEGAPQQKVNVGGKVCLSLEEYYHPAEAIMDAMEAYINQPFNLESDTLLRVALFHRKNGDDYLVFCTHHIIMDGWSLEVLIREVVSRYKTISGQQRRTDEALRFQFKDYVVWHQQQLEKSRENNQRFWNTYLRQYLWKPLIPYDVEFAGEKNTGAVYRVAFEWVKVDALSALSGEQQVSMHTLLLTAFNVLLYRMFGHTDICVGMVNSGRTASALQDQLGMFVKTLPLRTHVDPQQSFSDMLAASHKNILETDDHQDIPEAIENTLRLDVLLVLENPMADYAQITIDKDLRLELLELANRYSRLPLLISLAVNGDCLTGNMFYDKAIYQEETIALIALKYEKLLTELLVNPDMSLDSVDVELDMEKEKSIDISFDF
ncbi:non-ribosomal peptide synthetase [Chitinophaga sp. HK235]|uniref:non-ribosomal peptide synthetase n=1 Tax=Chitinophaga sp. HK235 TaxID=2952571 RepID=UPI001BA55359|nr:non-ribosomal peptide synthetase [Chitinophaga sp. HK235]